MSTTEQRARETGAMPRQWSHPGGRIHAHYSTRQLGTTVILTAQCGVVGNLADITGHNIGPTCRRCRAALARYDWSNNYR